MPPAKYQDISLLIVKCSFGHSGIQSPDRRQQTIGRIPEIAHSAHQRLPGSPPGKEKKTQHKIAVDVSEICICFSKDLITHSRELREDTKDLQKAHEFMLALPQRLTDSKFIENLSGYKGNIHKLGRLLRHVSHPHWLCALTRWIIKTHNGFDSNFQTAVYPVRFLFTRSSRCVPGVYL